MPNLIELFNLEQKKIYSIIGIAKNAGKTTLLNHLIHQADKIGRKTGVISIGYDGESIDLATKTEKPQITIPAGHYFATSKKNLELLVSALEIMESFSSNSVMGDIYLCKAVTPCKVELAGPRDDRLVKNIMNSLKSLSDYSFIDGALDRVSFGSPLIAEGVILAVSIAYVNTLDEFKIQMDNMSGKFISIPVISDNTKNRILFLMEKGISVIIENHENKWSNLPFTSLLGNEEKILPFLSSMKTLFLPGVVSMKSFGKLLDKINQPLILVLFDATRNFLTAAEMKKLRLRGINLTYLYGTEIKGIVSSCFHPGNKVLLEPEKLKRIIQSSMHNYKVIDLFYDL